MQEVSVFSLRRSVAMIMHLPKNSRLPLTLLVLLILPLAILYPFAEASDQHLEGAFKRSLAGFAIARGLNGVISVAQGTEFAVQPAGVGVVFAPGEILDPINDLVERFSWIMLLASSSLGVQQLLLSMSAWKGILFGLVGGGFALIAITWFGNSSWRWLRRFLVRFFLLMTILRFMMPVVSMANEWVYSAFLESRYTVASQELKIATDNLDRINTEVIAQPVEETSGLLDKAREIYRTAIKQIDLTQRLEEYSQIADTVSENIVWLIAVFLMQTVVFPLLFLWIVWVLIRQLFSYSPDSGGMRW